MDWLFRMDRRLLDQATDDGSDDGRTAPVTAADLTALIAEHGDAKAALQTLARERNEARAENAKLRKSNRELKDRAPDGSVILKGDDAKAWGQYKELGTPEDLTKALEQKGELEKQEAKRAKSEARADAAEAIGWKAGALEKIAGVDDLEFELREETVEGEQVKVPYVKGGEVGDTPKRLEDHAKEAWSDLLPALKDDGESGDSGGSDQDRSFQSQSSQGAAGKRGAASVDEVVKRKSAEGGYAPI